MRPVAAFDLDGTLFREQLIVVLIDGFIRRGVFPKKLSSEFAELSLNRRDRRIRYENYDRQIVEMFLTNITGVNSRSVAIAARKIAEQHRDWVYTFTRARLKRVKNTHECITITGANDHIVKHLASYWGFSRYYSTELVIKNGKYTGGEKSLPVLDKESALLKHIARGTSTLTGSIGIGDTASDIVMLLNVELAIAFNPSAELADEAERRHWPMVVERKDNIYVHHRGKVRRFTIAEADAAVDHVISLRKGKGK